MHGDRLASKLQTTVYRTYPLDEQLRERMSAYRESHGQTTAAFLANAILEHLPRLVTELQAVGIPASNGSARPTRLPMDQTTLDVLKQGSQATGIPATRLLAACIQRASRGDAE
jgi:hypothetical protein